MLEWIKNQRVYAYCSPMHGEGLSERAFDIIRSDDGEYFDVRVDIGIFGIVLFDKRWIS